jgi:hypothetical protein
MKFDLNLSNSFGDNTCDLTDSSSFFINAILLCDNINILYFCRTQQIYITITHVRATISWQHVSVALLQPSSGQYYTMCAFHVRTLWEPILITDDN